MHHIEDILLNHQMVSFENAKWLMILDRQGFPALLFKLIIIHLA